MPAAGRAADLRHPAQHGETRPIRTELGENKSKHGRHVTITSQTARELLEHVAGRDPSEYVFTTREGNPWRYPDFHSDRWQPAVHFATQSGLTKHATIHMLRHTAVVWSLARGVDIYTISSMLGHSSIQTTIDVYGGRLHLQDPKMARAMAQALMDVKQAITPKISQDEIEARKIRPGQRGEARQRADRR